MTLIASQKVFVAVSGQCGDIVRHSALLHSILDLTQTDHKFALIGLTDKI